MSLIENAVEGGGIVINTPRSDNPIRLIVTLLYLIPEAPNVLLLTSGRLCDCGSPVLVLPLTAAFRCLFPSDRGGPVFVPLLTAAFRFLFPF